MTQHNRIDLIEFPVPGAAQLGETRAFYSAVFDWSFTDYGPEYSDTVDSGVTSGFNATGGETMQKMPLAVLYVDDLEAAHRRVQDAGGTIVHEIYAFPGGRRFHFSDPAGNELAAWSE